MPLRWAWAGGVLESFPKMDKPCHLTAAKRVLRYLAGTITNARSKSIDIKYHYVRGTVSSQNIRFKFVPTAEQQADLLTKSLPSPAVMRFTNLVFGIAHFACVSCAHGLI